MIRRQRSHSKGLRRMKILPEISEAPGMSGSGLNELLEDKRNKVISTEITKLLDNLTVPEYPVIELESGQEEIETLPLPPEGHIGSGLKKIKQVKMGNPARDLIKNLMKSHM